MGSREECIPGLDIGLPFHVSRIFGFQQRGKILDSGFVNARVTVFAGEKVLSAGATQVVFAVNQMT